MGREVFHFLKRVHALRLIDGICHTIVDFKMVRWCAKKTTRLLSKANQLFAFSVCKNTKNIPISHYHLEGIFTALTFLKRGIFTLVKILFRTFSDAFTVRASIDVYYFHFSVFLPFPVSLFLHKPLEFFYQCSYLWRKFFYICFLNFNEVFIIVFMTKREHYLKQSPFVWR